MDNIQKIIRDASSPISVKITVNSSSFKRPISFLLLIVPDGIIGIRGYVHE